MIRAPLCQEADNQESSLRQGIGGQRPSVPRVGQILDTQLPSTTPLDSHKLFEGATRVFKPDDTLVVLNKTDLLEERGHVWGDVDVGVFRERCEGARVCAMSCKTGDGVGVFMEELGELLKMMYVRLLCMLHGIELRNDKFVS